MITHVNASSASQAKEQIKARFNGQVKIVSVVAKQTRINQMSDYDYEERVPFKDLSDDEKRERIAEWRDTAKRGRERYKDGKYMSLKESVNKFKDADNAGEKALAGAKIVGKSLFNIGRFAVAEALPSMLEQVAKQAEKSMKK